MLPHNQNALCLAAKSLQSCPTLCDPIDGSPPGSPIPGILQARTRVGCHFLLHIVKYFNTVIYLTLQYDPNLIFHIQLTNVANNRFKNFLNLFLKVSSSLIFVLTLIYNRSISGLSNLLHWPVIFLIDTSGSFGRRQWHPIPGLLPGKSHGRRSLVGRSPWGR